MAEQVPGLACNAKPPARSSRSWFKWLYLSSVLAASVLFTLAGSLYLNHRVVAAQGEALRLNRIWAERNSRYSDLGRIAAEANAPGNDVFASRDPDAEAVKLRVVRHRFGQALAAARTDLEADVAEADSQPLVRLLESINTDLKEMVAAAELIFASFRKGQRDQAGEQMAAMDRKYAEIRTTLSILDHHVNDIQQRLFDEQEATTVELMTWEFRLAGMVFLLVGGVMAYAIVLSRQVSAAARFSEHNLALLQLNEEALRKARDGLEAQVADRTAALRRATDQAVAELAVRQRAEEALHASEERLRFAARATNDAIWDWDLATNAVWLSEGTHVLFRYAPEEVVHQLEWWLDRIHPTDREEVHASVSAALGRGDTGWSGEYRFRRGDGSYAHVFDRGFVIKDEAGRPVRMVGSMMDVSDRKRAEEELQRAKEAAEAASRAKSEFLANMSHEIRTPMNGVLGMIELALDTDLTGEQRNYLGTVKTSADTLLKVINDILDFSKIEAGKLDLDEHDFRLRDVVGDTLKALSVRAHGSGLELACHIAPDVPAVLFGDSLRLRQILVNLVGNAIKFTERGEVVVDVRAEAYGDETVWLHFAIRDTGIGIPPDKLLSVFDTFTQADGSTTRRYGGTGLGLAISSQLVALMGGRIWVESQPGQGSTFHFTARLGLSRNGAQGPSPRRVDLEQLPVLVVDDNGTNRGILTKILAGWRMVPTPAASGSRALEEMRRAAASANPYPLVLLDALMPEMDGFAVVEEIRRHPELAGATILMLSSADRAADVARCRELGVATYLVKPIHQSELLNAILVALGSTPLEEPGRQKPPAPTALLGGRRLHLLVAEDNEVNQELAVKTLEKRGHTVVVAENGRLALDALAREHFDMVLMDVQMPEMDGFEATAAIRAREKETGGHIPIVALTAHAMKGDSERCLEAGMDAYVSKPLRADELFATLARLIEPARKEAINGPLANGAANGRPGVSSPFDGQKALERVEGDMDLLRKLVLLFTRQSGKLVADIRASVEQGDGAALERAAHKLKGSAGNFGVSKAYEVASRLEIMGRDGAWADARAISTDLEMNIEELQESLAALTQEGAR